MKKAFKWGAIITLVLMIISCTAAAKIYLDVKNTAQQLYVPLENDVSTKRTNAIDVASKEPFSALILGVDERDGDAGRSDTIIVLTVNPKLKTTKMISIPRDTYTDIVGNGVKDKINHAYAFGGLEMSMKTVEHLLNIPIDYVAQVNMDSFVDIVDIVGGITVNNTLAFHYEGTDFPVGEVELDGEKALKYVRMRYDDPDGDFGRQNRQKLVIQQVLKEAISLKSLMNYQSIFNKLENNVQVNTTFDELVSIQKNYVDSFKNIEQLHLENAAGTKLNGIYYYMLDDQELNTIQQTLRQHLEID